MVYCKPAPVPYCGHRYVVLIVILLIVGSIVCRQQAAPTDALEGWADWALRTDDMIVRWMQQQSVKYYRRGAGNTPRHFRPAVRGTPGTH